MATAPKTDTTEATETVVEEVKPKKKSVVQTVIEERMLQSLVSGQIWTLEETKIVSTRETLGSFMKTIKAALKMFDEELKNQRNIHGAEHLQTVEFFRKPRTQKEGESTSLLNDLSFGDDDEEDGE